MTGKTLRLKRLIRPGTGTSIIFAIDHGLTSPRLLKGLTKTRLRVEQAIAGGANVVLLSRGFARRVADVFRPDTSLGLMLTASAAGHPEGSIITPIGSIEEALRLGADAVAVFVALGQRNEDQMISYLSRVGEACAASGMPLLAEAEYPTTYMALDSLNDEFGPEYLKRNCRLCAELGADIIKTNWPGNVADFAEIVESVDTPVVVAGGARVSDLELLNRMAAARSVGAIGCSVGRNIFEHERPDLITRAITQVFEAGWSGQQAYEWLREAMAGGVECA